MQLDRIDQVLEQWQEERPDVDPSALSVVGRVLRLGKHMRRSVKAALAPHSLDLWSFDVLATLRRQGEPFAMSPTELRRAVILTSGAMTNRIDRLEQQGWVERLADPNDRRAVQVRLTSSGRELIDDALETRLANAEDLIGHLTADERRTLAGLLRKLLVVRPDEAKSQRPVLVTAGDWPSDEK
jgi:DNA-binding MarR family transcriptional regulator